MLKFCDKMLKLCEQKICRQNAEIVRQNAQIVEKWFLCQKFAPTTIRGHQDHVTAITSFAPFFFRNFIVLQFKFRNVIAFTVITI